MVIHVERHCRKIHAGGKPYTPHLNQLGRTIDVWRLIVKKKMGRNISTKKVTRAACSLGIPNPRDLSLQRCIKFRAEAYSKYRSYAKNVKLIHRPAFLDSLIDTKTDDGDQKAAQRLIKQKQEEESRDINRNVKIATKDFLGAPYKMELTTVTGSHLSSDKNEIESALITTNNSRYLRMSAGSQEAH